jgi:hypothetical protein
MCVTIRNRPREQQHEKEDEDGYPRRVNAEKQEDCLQSEDNNTTVVD